MTADSHVLVLHNRPTGWLLRSDDIRRAWRDRFTAHLVTHRFCLEPYDPALLRHTYVVPPQQLERWIAVAEWVLANHSIASIVTLSEKYILLGARLRDRYGIPGIDGAAATRFRDKVAMKDALAGSGVTVPKYAAGDAWATQRFYSASGRYVIKDRSGVGAQNVSIVDSQSAVDHRLSAAANRAALIVEEFVPGQMFHCDSIVWQGEVARAFPSLYLGNPGHFGPGRVGGSMLLPDGPVHDRIVEFSTKALAGLDVPDCVTHLEGFLRPDGEIVFCEVAARPGGGWIDRLVHTATGIDLIDSASRIAVGLPPALEETIGQSGVWACTGFYEIADDPSIEERVRVLPGVELVEQVYGRQPQAAPKHCTDYALRAVVRADTPAELHETVDELTLLVR